MSQIEKISGKTYTYCVTFIHYLSYFLYSHCSIVIVEVKNMSLTNWFSTFCSNIKIKNTASISSRYKTITKRLNIDFRDTTSDTANSLYVGSYGRNTAIDSISDLDMIYILTYEQYVKYNNYNGNGQSALLQAVKTSLLKTYSSTFLKADGQIVAINFTDNISFEIVPTFLNKDDSYTFPDSNNGGSWKTTNPKPEIEAIRSRNADCNKNLIPLCRMMRAWKNKWNVPIGGLLIDTLAYQFIENYKYRDKSYVYYDYMCRDFFKWMSDQSSEQEYWKAPGSGQYVYGKGLFQYKAKQCYNLAREAITFETADPKKEWSAKQKWREIFGNSFPD